MDAKWIKSPNYTAGRRGYRPESIVIHIMEGTLAGTDSWFRNRESKVSAHYGVGKHGEVHQYVRESDSAWHAGRKSADAPWQLLKPGVNPNYYTVGIEHEGKADTRWTDEMYSSSAQLIKEISLRWAIPIDRSHVIGHRKIYTVKTCPGSRVSLARLIREAKDISTDHGAHNLVSKRGSAAARARLNLRAGPTTGSKKVGQANAGDQLSYVGWTSSGEAVHGNPHWYRTAKARYFWAGGTNAQIPGVSA
jgi:N-acetyl-anhydromuramyl-L-alanine amidase AmpD